MCLICPISLWWQLFQRIIAHIIGWIKLAAFGEIKKLFYYLICAGVFGKAKSTEKINGIKREKDKQ